LKPGARIVFIRVCPVLKSFPQIGALFCFDSCSITGKSRYIRSSVEKGILPSTKRKRRKKIMEGAISYRSAQALLKRSMELWNLAGLEEISVEPHQMVTSPLGPGLLLELADILAQCSSRSILFLPFFTSAVEHFDVVAVENRLLRLDLERNV